MHSSSAHGIQIDETCTEESSGNLQETGEQYSTFSNILTASKNLIVSLERADIIDRFLITAALVVFGLVCLYIIKRRVLDKGIRVAGLLGKLVPTKAFSKRAADSVAAGSVRTNSLEETITAVTATATAAATLLSSSLSVTASNILSTSARQSSSSSSSQTSSLLSRVSSSTVSAESATPRPKAPQASTLASESPVIQPPDSVVDEPEPAPPSEPSITRSSAAQPMQEEAPDPVAEAHPLSASTTLTSTTADTIETFDVDTSSSTTVESSIDVLHSTLSVSLPIEEAPAVLDDLDDGEIIPTQHMTQIKEQLVDMGVLDRTEADAHFVDPTHVEHQQHQKHDEL